jgi:hypothetical protein
MMTWLVLVTITPKVLQAPGNPATEALVVEAAVVEEEAEIEEIVCQEEENMVP